MSIQHIHPKLESVELHLPQHLIDYANKHPTGASACVEHALLYVLRHQNGLTSLPPAGTSLAKQGTNREN